jgi:hypothetical protein
MNDNYLSYKVMKKRYKKYEIEEIKLIKKFYDIYYNLHHISKGKY